MKCKHKYKYYENVISGGYNIPDDCLCEYDIYCQDCNKYLGHWEYGSYDEEYYINTKMNLLDKIKYFLIECFDILKSKIRNKKIIDDELQF